MAVSYKRLWKLLVDKEMSKSDLRKKADIAPNTMTKLRRDEDVSLTILSKICKTLNVDFGDIVECQTAHCGRQKLHFDFGINTSPTVPYRHSPQALCGLTADCRSLV